MQSEKEVKICHLDMLFVLALVLRNQMSLLKDSTLNPLKVNDPYPMTTGL